jgi:hypothetical protein
MEKIMDFDEWLKNYVPPPIIYFAIYDNETGAVTAIYPDSSCESMENKVRIDDDLAQEIFDGKIHLSSCFVDLSSDVLEVIRTKSMRKIDDILHRVKDIRFSESRNSDILIRFFSDTKKIKFELKEQLRTKKIKWDGDITLKFVLCSYNDPHKIYQVVSFTLDELYLEDKEFDYTEKDHNFSVFTNRIFKRYLIEKV